MSFDLRPRRGSRAFERAGSDFKPKKSLGCFGSLSAGPGLVIGSGIGQVPEPQIASTNILLATFNPSLSWTVNGAAAIAAEAADQWDAGFIPNRFTSNNGVADFLSQNLYATLVIAATQYAVSGQFVFDADEATPSTAVRMAVVWTGGVARTDSIDFNPATGQIIAISAGLTGVVINRFSTTTGAGASVPVTTVSFVTPATPAGTNAGNFRIFPNVNAGVGVVEAGAFQVESGIIASAFIATSTVPRTRPLGAAPRFTTDRNIQTQAILANYSYIPGIDNGSQLVVTTNGVIITLPSNAASGEWVDIFYSGTTGNMTISAPGSLLMPGVAGAGITSLVLPYDGVTPAGGVGPYNVCGVRCTCILQTNFIAPTWFITTLAETHGVKQFTGNGTFTPGQGITTAWIDAAAGGAGGGGCAAVNSAAGGGGAGQAIKDNVFTVASNTAIAITMGTAGPGGAAGNNNGTAGGNTIIGALVTLTGGALGTGAASGATAAGGAAGGAGAQAGDAGQLIAGTLALGGEGGFSLFGMAESNPFSTGAGSQAGRAGAGFGAGGGGGSSSTTGAAAAGGNGTGGFVTFVW